MHVRVGAQAEYQAFGRVAAIDDAGDPVRSTRAVECCGVQYGREKVVRGLAFLGSGALSDVPTLQNATGKVRRYSIVQEWLKYPLPEPLLINWQGSMFGYTRLVTLGVVGTVFNLLPLVFLVA